MIGKSILVPVDIEEPSCDGLQFVAGLASQIPVYATLLSVVTLNVSPLDRRVYDELCREAEQRLRILADLFLDGQCPRLCVRVGKPHQEILAEAQARHAELIVLAGSKPSRSRWRFASTTTIDRVVREAPCPTLVLPRTPKISPQRYLETLEHAAEAMPPSREVVAPGLTVA